MGVKCMSFVYLVGRGVWRRMGLWGGGRAVGHCA